MSQNCRSETKKEQREQADVRREFPLATVIDSQARDPKKRKDTQARHGQREVISISRVKNIHALGNHRVAKPALCILTANPKQKRADCRSNSRQRRMLGLPLIHSLFQVFDAASY